MEEQEEEVHQAAELVFSEEEEHRFRRSLARAWQGADSMQRIERQIQTVIQKGARGRNGGPCQTEGQAPVLNLGTKVTAIRPTRTKEDTVFLG